MSYITDVVVHADYVPPEVNQALQESFYAGVYSSGNPRSEVLSPVDTSNAGGGKVFTGHLYAGSYNHLDIDAFLKWFAELPWSKYSPAVLSIASEEFYYVYCIQDGELKPLNDFSSM